MTLQNCSGHNVIQRLAIGSDVRGGGGGGVKCHNDTK